MVGSAQLATPSGVTSIGWGAAVDLTPVTRVMIPSMPLKALVPPTRWIWLTNINSPAASLATHINVSFAGCEGDSLIMLLDARGIAASTGSACASGVNRASRVLLAQGVPEELARGTLRLTLGYTTTETDIDQLVNVLPQVVAQARKAGMAGGF